MSKLHNYDPNDPLTPSETTVLDYLAEGLSNREIAEALSISPNTVKYHLRQIYSKLGANKRLEAVVIAQEIGLLDAVETTDTKRHHIPAVTNPIFGRAGKLASLNTYINRDDIRMVTVVGLGGVGKTRLALAAANQQREYFSDGVHFISLAPLTHPSEVPLVIASTLNFNFPTPHDPISQLLGFLSRKEMLLILDNFEHLLDDVSLIKQILTAAPRIKILCTSRQKLNLTGELIFAIDGLEYPQSAAQVDVDFGAIEWLVHCAELADPDFELTDDNRSEAATITRLLQGMPLAIELVATWSATLSLANIVYEVQQGLDVLSAPFADVPERHRSIYSVFEHSWRLLSPTEQDVFKRLAVFRGGFTLDSVREITGMSLQTLARLTSMSLVQRNRYTKRYTLHELLRSFAQEKLAQNAAISYEAHDHHAGYYTHQAAVWGETMLLDDQLQALNYFDAEYENIMKAWDHTVAYQQTDRLSQLADMWMYFEIRGYFAEGLHRYQSIMNALDKTGTISIALGKSLVPVGVYNYRTGDFDASRAANDRAIDILNRLDAEHDSVIAHVTNGNLYGSSGQPEKSLPHYEKALDIAQASGNQWYLSVCNNVIGNAYILLGDFDTAKALFHKNFDEIIPKKNYWQRAFNHFQLAVAYFKGGELNEAYDTFHEALIEAEIAQVPMVMGMNLCVIAEIDFKRGQIDKAESGYRHAKDLYTSIGYYFGLSTPMIGLAEIAITRGNPSQAYTLFRDMFELYIPLSFDLPRIVITAIQQLSGTAAQLSPEWSVIALDVIKEMPESTLLQAQIADLREMLIEQADQDQIDTFLKQYEEFTFEILLAYLFPKIQVEQ